MPNYARHHQDVFQICAVIQEKASQPGANPDSEEFTSK